MLSTHVHDPGNTTLRKPNQQNVKLGGMREAAKTKLQTRLMAFGTLLGTVSVFVFH